MQMMPLAISQHVPILFRCLQHSFLLGFHMRYSVLKDHKVLRHILVILPIPESKKRSLGDIYIYICMG